MAKNPSIAALDDIAARIAAVELLVRQLLGIYVRTGPGEPRERALTMQASAALMLSEFVDGYEEGHDKEQARALASHVARIYEDLIRGIEGHE